MSSVLEKHQKCLTKFIANLDKQFTEDEKLRELLKGKPFNQKFIGLQYDKKLKEFEGHFSYLKAIRTYLEDELHLLYSDAIYVVTQIFAEHFKGRTYLEAVQSFLEDNLIDPVNAQAEWRAYFENRFQLPLIDFFEDLLSPNENKSYHITINFAPWTFLGKQTLPVYLTHINIEEDSKPYEARKRVFQELGNVQPGYSFVWENVRNNVTTIFYFDHNPAEKRVMHIYEINPDVERAKGRGQTRYFGKWTINRKHRREALLDKSKPNPVVKAFETARNKSPEEKAYQYSVMRFLIRSGIFNPQDAAHKVRPGEPGFKDILAGAGKKLRAICEEQYDSSRRAKRHCFLEEDKYDKTENEVLDSVIGYIDAQAPEYIDERMAIFEEGLFWLTQDSKNNIRHIYWLPIVTNWRDRLAGGTIFINTDTRIGIPDDEPITKESKVPQKIITLLYYLTGLVDDKQIEEIEESIRPSVETSAAISIMSRNISHNIASHVLSYLKNILGDEMLMLENNVFENIICGQDGRWFFNEAILLDGYELNSQKVVAPYLRSLGKLLGYFQERQDYIGVMASGWYLYFGTVHFKEAVLDYFQGEQPARSADDTRTGKVKNLILDYIAYSEEYRRGDIIIEAQRQLPNGKMEDTRGLEIALPAGTTGRQGVFTILENFIRNTAKHGISRGSREEKQVKINLIIGEAGKKSKNYYRIDLIDNSGRVTEAVVEDIQKVLEADLVKPDGSVDEQHKGIKEMQIAAGWLRGIPPYGLADEKRQEGLPVLQVSQAPGNNLKYTFYLRKPKSVLFIVPQKGQFYDGGKLRKKYEHISHWDIEEYSHNINSDRAPYRFVVTHEALRLDEDQKTQLMNRSPVRLLEGLTNEGLKNYDKEGLENELYRRWLNENFKNDWRKRKIKPAEVPIGIKDPRRELSNKEKQFVAIGEEAYLQPILFRVHNDSKKDFLDFKEMKKGKYLKNKLFLEGISGGNSTNRLLREEEITPAWRLKVRETALTKVLIIDERIWKNMAERKEDRIFNHEKMALKNIHIFSLELKGEEMYFVNLRNEKVAHLKKNGKAEWLQKEESFHFVSLHQGLLDRMLSHCSAFLDEKGYEGEKARATHLFKKFKKAFVARNRFLIHSGRSKTPVLPSGTAFVQLSSLDTALSDCKFTLCELLYSSIVEVEA